MTKDAAITTRATSVDFGRGEGSSNPTSPTHAFDHAEPELVHESGNVEREDRKKRMSFKDRFSYFRTKDFWLILGLGQILALCVTGTNTLSTLLVIQGTSIPAFQSLFNYVLLNFIYTGYTIYKYGFKGWCKMVWKDGWKCN